MCGIFGFVTDRKGGRLKGDLADFIHQATLVGSLRGMDSVGFVARDQVTKKDGKLRLPISGLDMYKHPTMHKVKKAATDGSIFIGHNRAATFGSVALENCHPFQHDKKGGGYIIGVHNGTLTGWNYYKHGEPSFDVDSDWLYYQLANKGDEAFAEFDGSYALAYVESDKQALSLVCGKDRNLHFAFVKDHPAMVYASEAGMLHWLAERNDIQLEEIFHVNEGYRIRFPVDDPRKKESTELPKKKAKTSSWPHSNGTSMQSVQGGGGTNVGNNLARQTLLAEALRFEEIDKRDKDRVFDKEIETAQQVMMMGDYVVCRVATGANMHPRSVLNCMGVPEKESVEYECLLRRPSPVAINKIQKAQRFIAPVIGVIMEDERRPDSEDSITLILGEPIHYILRDSVARDEKWMYTEELVAQVATAAQARAN